MTIWLNVPFHLRFRVVDGLTVRFAVGGDGDGDVLLLGPWPETLLAFTPTWAPLAGRARLVAVDLPGFGHSQRRDTLLSPQAMGMFIVRTVEHLGLDRPHVVAPGVVTAAALFAAARFPGRLRSLVVGGGPVAVPLQVGGVMRDWVEARDTEQFRRVDPRQLVASALTGIERYRLPDAIRDDYLSASQGDRFAGALRYLRGHPAELPVLRDLLPQIMTPVQIIAGGRDTAVPAVNAEFLHDRLPHSRLDVIDAGHFVWEDAADEYARTVTTWWDSGYATTGQRETP